MGWFLIFFLVTISSRSAHCETILDDKYYLGETRLSYSQAVQACQLRSMRLISIENDYKNDEISELMRQRDMREDCWISGRTLPDRRSWVWLDGKPFRYQNWNPSRKHLLDHVFTDNCATIARRRGQLYWDDQFCQNLRCFVCEYPNVECNENRIRIRFEDHLKVNGNDTRTPRRKRFFVSTTRVTQQQAVDSCQSMSMELVSIYNAREDDEVNQLITLDRTAYWTSCHRASNTTPWMLSRGENASFFHWRSGEPNNARGDEFCVLVVKINGDFGWVDQSCSDTYRYICQAVLPRVDLVVNGNRVGDGGANGTTLAGQEGPVQVFIDIESGFPTDTRDRISWDYFISDNKVNHSEAISACRNRSQHLLTIANKDKNDLVFTMLEKNLVRGVFWTSATRNTTRSPWKWGNGSPITYFRWGRKSTNTKEANCIQINKTDSDVIWTDLSCNETRQFICEKTHVSSVNTAGGTILDVFYDDQLLYTKDSTIIVTST